MLTRQHALKSSRQIESKSTLNNPANETAKMKSAKSKSTPSKSPGKSEEKRLDHEKLDEIYEMIRTVMAKLDTLDEIKNRIVCVEQDFKQIVCVEQDFDAYTRASSI
ncbi:Hypothetical predicted protein [Paramuricea clavata]|uniref:Uncharacterized protein n=1 Tax=Paramuricea clavata TaxID=317549 RepID=A0A6S7H5R2_PARCT|nr:Hypothetical predicted protein [Paramuricea clavata]